MYNTIIENPKEDDLNKFILNCACGHGFDKVEISHLTNQKEVIEYTSFKLIARSENDKVYGLTYTYKNTNNVFELFKDDMKEQCMTSGIYRMILDSLYYEVKKKIIDELSYNKPSTSTIFNIYDDLFSAKRKV